MPQQPNIGIITLSRPETLNAMSRQLLTELNALPEQIAKDENIRVIIITGSGEGVQCSVALKEVGRLDETEQ